MPFEPEQAKRLLDEAAPGTGESEACRSPLDGLLPVRVGPNLVHRLIASGGMGTVYEATQASTERPVALKLIHPFSLTHKAIERFRFEATILSRLRHPNIATVYDAGTAHIEGLPGEWPYYTMELIEDAKPIDGFARAARLPINRRLRLLIDAADAVHHAHQRAIIHRDIKPDNVLVGADGIPKVIDFGIAASFQTDPNATLAQTFHTATGQVLGSFQFMAPEQFDSPDVDVRADVYALGMILYLLLTDTLPYDVTMLPLPAAASRIKSSVIKPPSSQLIKPGPARSPRLHNDLDAITLKALAPTREKRYPSAAALADDLRAHLNDDPITARPPSRWQRTAQWIGRHPFAATITLCVAMILATTATTAGGLWWYLRQPYKLEFDASTRRVRVLTRGGTELSVLDAGGDWEVMYAVQVHRDSDSIGVVCEYLNGEQRPRTRGVSVRNLNHTLWTFDFDEPGVLTIPHPSFRMPTHGDHWGISACQAEDVFPEYPGEEIVLRINYSPEFPGAIVVLSASDGHLIHVAWHTGAATAIVWLPEERMFVVGASCNRLPWWKLESPSERSANHPKVVFAYRPTPEPWNDTWLASPTSAPHSTLWYAVCTDPALCRDLPSLEFDAMGAPNIAGFPFHFQMTNGGIGMNSLGVAWELGPGGPVKETPDIPSAVRSRTHVQQSDKSRLVLLRDFHPIGDRDWHTEMPDEP